MLNNLYHIASVYVVDTVNLHFPAVLKDLKNDLFVQ